MGKRQASPTKISELKLDALARAIVFRRDVFECQICGTNQRLQWSHVRSRRYKAARWMTSNSKVLCAGCHMKWHEPPPGFDPLGWFKLTFPGRLEKIDNHILVTKYHPRDKGDILKGLEREWDESSLS